NPPAANINCCEELHEQFTKSTFDTCQCLWILILISVKLLLFYVYNIVQIIDASSSYSESEINKILKQPEDISAVYSANSETHRPLQFPLYQHSVPISVPHYVYVPQSYPKYHHVQHNIEVPVYKVIPEIVEKPVPYTIEKHYPVEKPFPVEVIKRFEIPVPKPYPVHVVYYKHVSEYDPSPIKPKPTYASKPIKYGGVVLQNQHHEFQFRGY
ncbi:CLUMA_CG018951, isoform A, partial [Clunio marinus]